jgi:DNA repair ATPase RecN
MTAKEYLGRAYRIDGRINAKLEQVASLRELATKATSSISDMPRSSSFNPHSMQNIIDKIIDLEREINSDIDALVNIKQEVVTTIKRVDNPEYQTLLEMRYLCFKSWEQISMELGYDLRWIYRLHQRALAVVKDIII